MKYLAIALLGCSMAAMAQTAKTNSPKLDMKMAITQSALWDEMNNSPSLKDCRDADWPDTFACNFMARATLRIAREYWVRDHAKHVSAPKSKRKAEQ